MMTAIERLEALLNEQDAELEELRAEKREREYGEEWGWTRHAVSEEREGLPVPRLEIRWTKLNEWQWVATYGLVYRHLLGNVIVVPLGVTRSSGFLNGPPVSEDRVQTPWRDGCHILHDMRTLNLPGFAICGDVVMRIEPEEKEETNR